MKPGAQILTPLKGCFGTTWQLEAVFNQTKQNISPMDPFLFLNYQLFALATTLTIILLLHKPDLLFSFSSPNVVTRFCRCRNIHLQTICTLKSTLLAFAYDFNFSYKFCSTFHILENN